MICHSKYKVDFTSLHSAFNQYGFTGTEQEKMLIEKIEDYCINEKGITPKQMFDLNHAAIQLCCDKNIKTYAYYIALLANCKTLKNCDLNINDLKYKYCNGGK